jgi:hypothetical protein
MSLDERSHLQQLLAYHSRNAQEFEAQLANFGREQPPHLLSELAYERTCIEALQRQLRPHGSPPPPTGDLLFVNQIEALTAVLNQPQASNFVIDAPAGYGKTLLLKELSVQLVQAGWYVRSVAFSDAPARPLSHLEVIASIARHFNIQPADSAEDIGRRIAQELRQRSAAQAAGKDAMLGSVLIFDTLEQITTDTHLRSYDALKALLRGLREGSSAFPPHSLRLIMAGRYIGQYLSISGDSIVVNLKPFDRGVIGQAIATFFASQGVELSFERGAEMAQHILYITGGHPAMIKQVLMDEQVGLLHHQALDLRTWRADSFDDIRDRIVAPMVSAIRRDLPEKLWGAIEVLCVYRKVHRVILKQLLAQEIQGYSTHFELVDDLKKARLIRHTGSTFTDGILRPTVVRWLQHTALDRFAHYCGIAQRIFAAQLGDPAEGMTRAGVLAELFYLALIQEQAAALSDDEELRRSRFAALHDTMAGHLRTLQPGSADRDTLKELFDDLLNALRADAELAFLFDYTFGTFQSYDTFVSTLCDSDAPMP